MSRRSRRRSAGQQPDQAPVLLPHVLITVTETGLLDVTVDGAPYPPTEGKPWTRAEFGNILDAITQDQTTPVRVEVHEADGTVFTDLLRPHIRPTSPAPETLPAVRRGRHAKDKLRPAPLEVTADGFLPGEDVVVAVVLTHTTATSTGTADSIDGTGTGTARALLDIGQLRSLTPDGVAEVVLHGRASGVTQVRRLS